MHIVFCIHYGGGPQALINNISKVFLENNVIISVIAINPERDITLPINGYHTSIRTKSRIIYYLKLISKRFLLLRVMVEYIDKVKAELSIFNALKKIDNKHGIDVVEVIEGQFINRISKHWKVVTRAHGSNWSFREFCQDQDKFLDYYLKLWQAKQHRLSSANFAISRHTRSHLKQVLKLNSLEIQYQPYPINLVAFSESQLTPIVGVPCNAKIILSIGRLESRKGMHTIVEAMKMVWRKEPNAFLCLLGKENDFSMDYLKNLVDKAARHKIISPGHVPYELIPRYYKSAMVYVSASKYETFGYTLLEAMAAETPIVCTNRGAMPELVQNGVNGTLVNYNDIKSLAKAIVELLESPELRMTYKKNGLEIAQKYSLEKVGIEMLNSYDHILNV